jgi:hypothetical protein
MAFTRILHSLLILIATGSTAHATGLWVKSPGNLTIYAATRYFVPDVFFVKTAVFGRAGDLHLIHTFEALVDTCGKKFQTAAWVTHWLAADESLKTSSAKTFAENLNAQLLGTCFTSIQIDLEPLPEPPPWLVPWLKEVRRLLSPSYALTLAIPTVTPRKLEAPTWTPEQAKSVVDVIDGLDLMIYDTGVTTDADYGKLLVEAFDFAETVMKSGPKKIVTLGLPAYKAGNPKVHNIEVENLSVAKILLRSVAKEKARILCDTARARISYYPDWSGDAPSIDDKDKLNTKDIEKWKIELCQGR